MMRYCTVGVCVCVYLLEWGSPRLCRMGMGWFVPTPLPSTRDPAGGNNGGGKWMFKNTAKLYYSSHAYIFHLPHIQKPHPLT